MALVVAAGIVFASSKLISIFEGLADDPLSGRATAPVQSPVQSGASESGPDPTVTVTAAPPPSDTQIVKQNKLYAGRLTATCKEPACRPTSRVAVGRYLQAMLTCLNHAWAPIVTKAGYEIRAPKLVWSPRARRPAATRSWRMSGSTATSSSRL